MLGSEAAPLGEIAAGTKSKDTVGIAAVKDLAFGSAGGMIGKVFEYPFDTVKVRLQSQPNDRPLRYKGPLDCFKQSLASGGIRGLYRGISPPLVGAAVENSALFFGYNIAQKATKAVLFNDSHSDEQLPMNALLLCGAASGAFTSLVLTPIELVKCKMQVQQIPKMVSASPLKKGVPSTSAALHTASAPRPPGPIALVGEIYRVYGLTGLWHGQMGTFFRETAGGAAWFGAYEYVCLLTRKYRGRETNSTAELMLAGACAGVAYNGALFPADTVKSRMQTEAIGVKSRGFWTVGREIYSQGGIKALYRGCGITVLRSAPSSAIIFTVYEGLKAYFA